MLRSVSIQRLTVTQVLTVSRASHVTNRYKNFHRLLSTQTVEKVDFHGTDKLRFQDSVIGHLSEASVVGSIGGTVVHVAINSQHNDKAEDYFLPLTVDYRTRNYATGKIPLARTKRESHNSEEDTLVARFIDRAIRPLFPKGYVNEVQVIATTHAADGVYDPTVVAVNATSYALMKSKQPWRGPVGCVRVGLIDGQLKVKNNLDL